MNLKKNLYGMCFDFLDATPSNRPIVKHHTSANVTSEEESNTNTSLCYDHYGIVFIKCDVSLVALFTVSRFREVQI